MKILLVDDQPENVESLANAIRRGGHTITTESDPVKALDLFREEPFEAVITDVRMPKLNGIELLKAVREIDHRARVILITSYGDARTAMAAINNNAWAMLCKPISISTMMDTLNSIEKDIAAKAASEK